MRSANSKQIWLKSPLHERVERKRIEENYAWDITKYIHDILSDYVAGKLKREERISSEKLFVTLLGLGMIDRKKFAELRALIAAGVVPYDVASDKFGLSVEPESDRAKKK